MTKYLLFISLTLCVRTSLAADVPKDFDALVKVLAEEERKLTNLVVESEMWEESPDAGGDWARTGVGIVLKAWYNWMAGGPVRFDIAKEVNAQEHGPEGPFESSYSVSFDGKVYKRVAKTGGRKGIDFEMKEAEVLAERPTVLASGWKNFATGAGFSTYLYNAHEGRSLSQELRRYRDSFVADKTIPVIIAKDQWSGVDALVLRMGKEDSVQETWWFDPTRSYALLAYHITMPPQPDSTKRSIMVSYDVAKLVEAAPGIWYPTEGTYLMPPDPDRGLNRYKYTASSVVANDPNFDPAIFTLTAPAGYAVYDHVENRTFIVAPTTQQLERDLEDAINDATRAVENSTTPSTTGTDGDQ